MTPRTAHPVAPYLLLAELGAALFGGTAASAEERITLEIIGAVRMTGPGMVRPADATQVRAEDTQAREASVERPSERIAARHN
ncbi:hypothetical protein [Methylobacterium oryzae]|uniref:hypothetical protein n=1 Tax=Methylobacterium oryzae TaxID=334852 RepID=UPI001F1D3341|nr:hypothetical protein [Methylobacterium oryzae]UIN35043.1 hypothetical protein LXM90_00595 [Methylobacterium oryzae]